MLIYAIDITEETVFQNPQIKKKMQEIWGMIYSISFELIYYWQPEILEK